MRHVFLLIAAAGVLAGCRSGATAQSPELDDGAGQVQGVAHDPYRFSFGSIRDSKPVAHEFVIENKGQSPVNITGKTDSCGCVSSKIDKEVIPPGGSAKVTVTFNPKGYSGMVSQFVFVSTDDPDHPAYRFMIEADVR